MLNAIACNLSANFHSMTLSARQLSQSTRRRERLVKIVASLPEVTHEVVGDGHISFKIRKKIFAYYSFDHHGDEKIAFLCKSTLNDQRRLIAQDSETFFVPAYVGPRGWVAIRLDLDEVDWDTVTDLSRQAYQATAPKKLAALIEEET